MTTQEPDLAHQWKTEEPSISGNGYWTILVQATRLNGEEILGWDWVPMHDAGAPTAAVCFHRDAATVLLRTLYSTFAALNDPNDYLNQIGLGWTVAGGRPPSSGVVGSTQDHGSVQVHADWGSEHRLSRIMIYPPDTPRIHVELGIDSIAHLIQLTTEAFRALDWPVPE